MRVLGMISGTSHDGIDVAVVDFELSGGVLHGRIAYTASTPYAGALRDRLVLALPPARVTLAEVCGLDTLIGQAFAEAAVDAVGRAGPVDLVCSHGQTVYHWVEGQTALGTLQLGQAAWIAERTGAPVVADLRIRDITAGGQGAPLVSLMDTMLLARVPGRPAALNLGGIANLTVLRPPAAESRPETGRPPGARRRPGPDATAPLAFDTGPANALIDAAALRASAGRLSYDRGGALAAAGTVHSGLLERLLAEAYYALDAPKTTGKELFNADYLSRALAAFPDLAGEDVVATVTALTARTVGDQVRRYGVDTLVASGGGCDNPVLMAMLEQNLAGVRVASAAEFGAPPDAKEAIAFALLGWFTAHALPASVASATGARGGRVLGAIVPGRQPLRLPEPVPVPPTELRLAAADAAV